MEAARWVYVHPIRSAPHGFIILSLMLSKGCSICSKRAAAAAGAATTTTEATTTAAAATTAATAARRSDLHQSAAVGVPAGISFEFHNCRIHSSSSRSSSSSNSSSNSSSSSSRSLSGGLSAVDSLAEGSSSKLAACKYNNIIKIYCIIYPWRRVEGICCCCIKRSCRDTPVSPLEACCCSCCCSCCCCCSRCCCCSCC